MIIMLQLNSKGIFFPSDSSMMDYSHLLPEGTELANQTFSDLMDRSLEEYAGQLQRNEIAHPLFVALGSGGTRSRLDNDFNRSSYARRAELSELFVALDTPVILISTYPPPILEGLYKNVLHNHRFFLFIRLFGYNIDNDHENRVKIEQFVNFHRNLGPEGKVVQI